MAPLGLVVSEHVDKLSFFEPGVQVLEKALFANRIVFRLRLAASVTKPLTSILRAYRIGCFRIAREYGLITPSSPRIFADCTR